MRDKMPFEELRGRCKDRQTLLTLAEEGCGRRAARAKGILRMAWQRRRGCECRLEVDWTFQAGREGRQLLHRLRITAGCFFVGEPPGSQFRQSVQGPRDVGERSEPQDRVGVSTNGEYRLDSFCKYHSRFKKERPPFLPQPSPRLPSQKGVPCSRPQQVVWAPQSVQAPLLLGVFHFCGSLDAHRWAGPQDCKVMAPTYHGRFAVSHFPSSFHDHACLLSRFSHV